MKSQSRRGVLAYLVRAEESSTEEWESRQRPTNASGPEREALALAKAGLWIFLSLVFAYCLSRLSSGQATF